MSLNVQASGGCFSTHNLVVPQITRRSANFHPTVWGDHFLTYTSDLTKTDVHAEGQFQQLEEEVKKMLLNAADKPQQQLSLIDGIQRLGVSYHFESEIEKALQHINDTYHECNNDDLYTAALRFRLLRQHGHNVTCEVFHKFKDNNGKFKEDMVEDVKGMLSLYEATYFRVHGEDILEEAQQFTTSHLKRITSHLSKPLAAQVVHALKVPIQRGLARLQARHYISVYHEDDSHNEVLLKFAKLDFNILQKMHQRELSDIMRWRKDLDLEKKLPFARDRGVECYFWILGVFFEPQYSLARRLLTKVICVASLVDDIYDVYGTLEELEVFTDAIQRWHVSSLNQLPEYMKFCYQILLDVYSEMEEEMGKTGRLYRVDYAKDEFKRLARGYFDEAKWFYRGYIPTMDEYLRVALVTGAYMMLATNSFVGMGEEATKEAFDWMSSDPLIVRAASVICRFSDDMVGHREEQERGNVSTSVECYMKQHGVSKEVVFAEFRKRVENAWKDINQECLRPTAIAMPLLTRVVNLARVINFLYDEFDGYTNSNTRTKDFITLVLKNPIPL